MPFLQVQSEILKKWKRWKLGRNIEEEYRHTYSHTVHLRGGSLVTQPSVLPLNFPDVTATTTTTSISTTATASTILTGGSEEKHTLVGCQNGMGRRSAGGGGVSLSPFDSSACEGALQDDILLVDKVQCHEPPLGSSESNL